MASERRAARAAARAGALRIAQVAPLFVRVPPVGYGGTERVVAALTEELVRRGHDVTLFAAGTSVTAARLRAGAPRPLWELGGHEHEAYRAAQVEDVVASSSRFDVIHSHVEYLPWLAADRIHAPIVTTLHGRLDGDGLERIFRHHCEQPLVSISDAQRAPLTPLGLNWIATIRHGLELPARVPSGGGRGGFLAFVGRTSPDKGLATAIRVALRCGIPIKVAARVDPDELTHHQRCVAPLLDHPLVEWLGEVDERRKLALLADARGLLMPIDWEEPFGLSFIEALAVGTPVVTRPRGALPELMLHGRHGFLAESEDDLVEACRRLIEIDRRGCREWAARRFSLGRMVDEYELVYRAVVASAADAA